jgi:putative addiction module component (TIGR02574 family)
MTSREQILQDALALAPEDRAFVVDQLEQSLDKGGFASPEIAAAWAQEIGQRVAAYDRGEIQAENDDVVMRRMRRFLSEHQRRKAES